MADTKQLNFTGPFAEMAESFILYKQSLGYKYESEKKMLRLFCEFTEQYPVEDCVLSKELVEAWFTDMNDVAIKTKELRISVMKLFARYMQSMGYSAYVIPKIKLKGTNNFVPYIFTHQEIASIFRTCDETKYEWRSRHTQLIMPVIIRLLYSCGLRVSEALNLKIKDVDLNNGILTLHQTKTGRDRYVPLSMTTLSCMKSYFAEIHSSPDENDLFFRKKDGRGYAVGTIHHYFKTILWKSGISYGGKGKGPRLHDLRHTFAVHALSRWVEEGKDIYCLLPVLASYLGHSNIKATSRYLRLTAEVFPQMMKSIEKHCASAIPEVTRS